MKLKEQDFLPVILGADITAYSLARSFHEEYGIRSLVISQARGGYITNSDIIENRVFPGMEQPEIFVQRLTEVGRELAGKKKLLLFGCSDWYVREIVDNRDALAPYYVIPYVDKALLERVAHKESFYALCEELSVPYPKTYVHDCTQEALPEMDLHYPLIAKPADSALYHLAKFPGKKKVFLLHSREELETLARRLQESDYNYKFLLQEYIPGGDEQMGLLTCYSDRNGKVRMVSFGRKLLEDHTPTAIGNSVAVLSGVNDAVAQHAIRFLEHIGYTGYSHFDVKFDPAGNPYFFEINTRLARCHYYTNGAGVNPVRLLVDDLLREEELPFTVAGEEHLFTVVPRCVLMKYLPDAALRETVRGLYRQKRVSYPLRYRADRNLKRKFYVAAVLLNQIRKFHKFYPVPGKK